MSTLEPGGAHLTLWQDEAKTLEAIGARSRSDADRYRAFATLVQQVAGFLRPLMSRPTLQPQVEGATDLLELLKVGVAFRRLGAEPMYETLRMLPMSIADLLNDWFEDDLLKATLAVQGIQGVSLGPRSAGSAAVFLYHQLGAPAWSRVGWSLPRGGAGAIGEALANAARAHGATIRLAAPVQQIVVTEGRVTGIVLDNGDELRAGCVVSATDPGTTFLDLLEPGTLEPEFLRNVQNIRYRGVTAKLLLALDRPPSFTGL